MRLTTVAIDGNKDESVQGYTDDTYWNGWLNVWFTREQLIAYLDMSPYDYRFSSDGEVYIYDEDNNTIDKPKLIQTNDGQVLAYDMNGYCFDEIGE